ncbi:MAG: hypothetical protein CMD68_02625 [Gammaproteobacteria bacterium]|nr:hypothetical protein [Gammaproteobacteria bacterium]|tara:strand:+ start:5891 stop:6454 length:564 start_codon:yes stop_codon:yes gene_type:complete
MNTCANPTNILDLCQDILDIVIRKVRHIKIHKSLKKRWSLYGSFCSLSKPCNQCDCGSICFAGGGPGQHFHPGRNILNIYDKISYTPPSQWNLSSYYQRWQSLKSRKYSQKYYIAGVELIPSVSTTQGGYCGPSFIVLETLRGLYELCNKNRWDDDLYNYNDNNKVTKNQIIRFIMDKEEEEINKFI